jgi:hypothetical protein
MIFQSSSIGRGVQISFCCCRFEIFFLVGVDATNIAGGLVKYLLRLGWSRCQDGVRLVFDTVPDSSSQVPSQKNDWSLDSAEWKSRRW